VWVEHLSDRAQKPRLLQELHGLNQRSCQVKEKEPESKELKELKELKEKRRRRKKEKKKKKKRSD